MREQIIEWLAQGYTQADTAKIVGVTPAVITEYLQDEGFKELLRAKMQEHTNKRLNTKYDALEERTLKKIQESIEMCEISDLTRVLESISRVKNANRVTNAQQQAGTYNNPTIGITLVMPQHQIPQVVTDERNQIIAIGSKSMAPMPASNVKTMFAEMEGTASNGDSHDKERQQRRESIERDAAIAAAQKRLTNFR